MNTAEQFHVDQVSPSYRAPGEPAVRPAPARQRPPAAGRHRDEPRHRDRKAATGRL